jgi:hypothetical protein
LFNSSNTAGVTVSLAQSFGLAQLAVERAAKVILVNQPGDSLITGADAGAALVAGIAGIVDDRLLLTDRVLKSFLTHQRIHSRWETMLAVGETAGRLRNVKAMFAEWDEDDANDYSLYASCFKACMALAQLDRLNTVRGQGRRYSYLQLARALNLAHTVTFFHLSEGDLRKVLSIIANRLIPSVDEGAERLHLPSYVKNKWEFPHCLPALNGITNREIYQVLYEVCRSVEVAESGLNLDYPTCVARLSSKELRRHRRVKRIKEKHV